MMTRAKPVQLEQSDPKVRFGCSMGMGMNDSGGPPPPQAINNDRSLRQVNFLDVSEGRAKADMDFTTC